MKLPLPKTALVIEDDVGLQSTLVATLRSIGYDTRACETAEVGLAQALGFKPTLIFCDVHLGKGDGRKVLAELRASSAANDCQFVLMTGDWVGAPRQESIEIEADDYLAKPFSLQEFVACVNERYRQANL
jgi:DNA-binding response OmpR family regulator